MQEEKGKILEDHDFYCKGKNIVYLLLLNKKYKLIHSYIIYEIM